MPAGLVPSEAVREGFVSDLSPMLEDGHLLPVSSLVFPLSVSVS